MKAHILVVEDESILYERLRRFLINENYGVDKFTPDVDTALERIHFKKPDIVLLDIQLEGDKSGLYLGKLLSEQYKIPFIYVTDLGDDETFYEGLHTNHEFFIVKTKPNINTKELLRVIQTILKKNKPLYPTVNKTGILGLVDYKDKINKEESKLLNAITVPFENIFYFSNLPFDKANILTDIESLKENYLWFKAKVMNGSKSETEILLMESSLDNLVKQLPLHFARINQNYIVNLHPSIFKGRVNGSYIRINDQEFNITRTYKKELEDRIKKMYLEL